MPRTPNRPVSVLTSLSQFVATTPDSSIPADTVHEAKRSLMNFFAVALAGCNDPTLDKITRAYRRFQADTGATIIGRGERSDILTATALNAMSANVYDFDDTHMPTILHPTAMVAPVLFALSQSERMTGATLLSAFTIGVDVACRIANAVSPFHYAHGWHITGTCGVFGASAAAARVLHLSSSEVSNALGIAGGQACGVVENLGTMAKSVAVGSSARAGLLAAILAKEGVDGPAGALEGTHGFLTVYGRDPDLEAITDGLGQRWELHNNTYKPFPCGVVLNPVIEACLRLAKDESIRNADPAEIEAIVLTGHPLLRQRTDRPNIQTGRQSQVSAQHAVPVALLRGRASLQEFSDAAVADPILKLWGEKVRFLDDEQYPVDAADVTIEFRNGRSVHASVSCAAGSIANPLSDTALEDKLREHARSGGSGCDPEPLIDAIWRLDTLDDVSVVLDLAAGIRDTL